MRIEYENKFSDLLLFNAVHQFRSPVLQGLYLLFFALFFWSELNYGTTSAAATSASLWYLAMWVLQFGFNAAYLFSKDNKSVLTMHIVEIQDEAFFEETKFNKSFFYWPGIVKAVSRPGFVAVYVAAHMAHIIPNRAFSSKEQRDRFLALVREKIDAA
ncbi:YcxB family protein [Polaromonas sp. CT11-55]|uniref:YcxB family protein n=1 Tax=Polaromonas sp. CT11-55 TaxID=3243045 RepID=UPI0039A6EF2E